MPLYLTSAIVDQEADGPTIRSPYSGDPRIGSLLIGPENVAGKALIWLPESVVDARLDKLADAVVERPTPATRNRLGNALGITLVNTQTIAELFAQVLMDHGRDDGTRWRGIRGFPSKARGQWEIWLGELGVIWAQKAPPTPSTKRLTESWPTDGTTFTSGQDNAWAVITGAPEVSGGKLINPAGADPANCVSCTDLLDTANQRHRAEYTMVDSSGVNPMAVIVRGQGQTNNNHYRFQVQRRTGAHQHLLRKRVASVNTDFYSDTADPGGSGVVLIEVDGSTVRGSSANVNTTPQTDASPSLTLNRRGECFVQGDLAGDQTLDNHIIEDVTAMLLLVSKDMAAPVDLKDMRG